MNKMLSRRERLELGLGILPYNPKAIQLSAAQDQVETIIARLSADTGSFEETESDEDKAREKEVSSDAAVSSNHFWNKLCVNSTSMSEKLVTLAQTAEKLGQTRRNLQEKLQKEQEGNESDDDDVLIIDEGESVTDLFRSQLIRNTIMAMNEARLRLLQRWERTKRSALDLLTIEIEKVQAMDLMDAQTSSHFDLFCDGTDEHNTSTPRTIDSDEENNDEENNIKGESDDDYVPPDSGKRKRQPQSTSTPRTSTPQVKRPRFSFSPDENSPMVVIGPNGTQIPRRVFNTLNVNLTGPAITRKLLCEIFDRDTLAYHTLSGKPSPAFKDCARPSKQKLDPLKVDDLVYLMTTYMDMTPRDVRTAITTKCADENKMLRARLLRQPSKLNQLKI
ncbi:early boundary activity protein 1 [Scaptodrosophila lebanonensis]|uniref:Early boundary activity protein 1 n=1 Tax=Drosophila lebanonensis TaxID=7225 RepID=A0A6J2U517_DROLE|nr:early boundary activity protein 1 [Scaptodrosophila lebanonensis]